MEERRRRVAAVQAWQIAHSWETAYDLTSKKAFLTLRWRIHDQWMSERKKKDMLATA